MIVSQIPLLLLACDGFVSEPRGASGPSGPDPTVPDPTDPLGEVACTVEQPGPRVLRPLTRAEYQRTVADLFRIDPPSIDRLPVENRVSGYANNATEQTFSSRHVDEYLASAEAIAETAFERSRGLLVTCDLADAGCQRAFVTEVGTKIFRRPLDGAEIDRYASLFDPATGATGDVGGKLVLSAMLLSPSFLYRSEVGELAEDGRYRLTSFEVATALSYLFTGTTPDDELLGAAARGELADPVAIEAQARRLLALPAARVEWSDFASEWLGTYSLRSSNKDAAIYPAFTTEVREAMFAEERRFTEHVVFEGTARVEELFDPGYVFVNETLRQFYALETPPMGSELARVELAGDRTRGGILRMGSVLASHAHATDSSPILRGLFVRRRLLCQDLPPPPVGADTTPPGLDPTLTTRARFARHTSEPTCRSCHQYIDDVGFGFEAYDGVGAYRAEEAGQPIDESGVLAGTDELDPADTHPFVGPGELASLLAELPRANACLARHWFRYARGFVERPADQCAIDALADDFDAAGGDIRELVIRAVTQRSFLERRPGEPEMVAP